MLVAQSKDAFSNTKQAPKKVQQVMAEPFVFVPITQNEASQGRGAAKRIVRAHVTRVQHAKSSTLVGVDIQSWTVKPYIHRDSITTKRKPKKKTPSAKVVVNDPSEIKRESSLEKRSSSTTSREASAELVVPRLVDNAAEDPFWSFAVDYEPNISPIFAHYIQNIAVDIPDIDGLDRKGRLRRELFPLCMTDAATMYAVLLMGASHYCTVNPSKAALIDLLALKARALSEINSALANPRKATTDAIIMAVAKMAAYESIFGDSEVFAAHMRGLQMMLKLRGGLSQLGLGGLVERMVVWIDLNACHLTGLSVHLGTDEHPTTVQFAAPDPFHFAGIQ